MASKPKERPEFVFQSVNPVQDVITRSAPDEAYTLVVDAGGEEMPTFFVTRGSLIYIDAEGHQVGYGDVFTRLQQACERFGAAGLEQSILDAMIR